MSDVVQITRNASGVDDPDVPTTDDEVAYGPIPWHGLLAVEGVKTGDRRMFAPGSLRARDLPLPLTYRHKGPVIGQIAKLWRVGNQVWGSGTFNDTAPADEAIGMIQRGDIRGVSIDGDDWEESFADRDLKPLEAGSPIPNYVVSVMETARISGLALEPIAAFAECFIRLGEGPDDVGPQQPPEPAGEDDPEYDPEIAADMEALVAAAIAEWRDFPAAARKQAADAGHAMDDGSFPIKTEEDLRNAIHAIGRAKNPAAAKRHIKKRAAALGKSDLIPEGWAADTLAASADVVEFWAPSTSKPGTHDGPGWITNPKATERIRRYWVRGKGAAKIRWGQPHDFYRCRKQLAKYVQNPEWLNGLCANMHKEALKVWPGQEASAECLDCLTGPALVAAAGVQEYPKPPAAWFRDPQLEEYTASPRIERDEETGLMRVYGHAAQWGSCHVAWSDRTCVTPPHSPSDYSWFLTRETEAAESLVLTGPITLATTHAGMDLSFAQAVAHYDDTGNAVADVVIGEDEHGIWFSGWVRPWASQKQIHELRASSVSGDWRQVRGGMEMIGLLSVNAGGFPGNRTRSSTRNGQQFALVAAGWVAPSAPAGGAEVASRADELADAVELALDKIEERRLRREADALAARFAPTIESEIARLNARFATQEV